VTERPDAPEIASLNGPARLRHRATLGLVLLLGLLGVGTVGFHFIERWSWFDGFYMALTTMSTVGYGELHPLSTAGRAFASFLILASVVGVGYTIAASSQALLQFEFGKALGRRRMERELAHLSGHYIICGAGRVGRTAARELRDRGHLCVLIEKDPARAQWALDQKIPVVVGNASSEETLRKARIETARGFVTAVSSDAENLYIVLTARGVRSDLKIIARASEEEAIPKLLRAGANEVLSPYHFVGRRIAHILLQPNVLDFIDTAFGTERLDVSIAEVVVDPSSTLVAQTIGGAAVRREAGVIILGVKPVDRPMRFNPSPETVIGAGDCLIVIADDAGLKKLETLAGSAKVAR
jgi:voltage-gated potassium channel